jgi:Fic family protein
MMKSDYMPPYSVSPAILSLVGEICEWIGRHSVLSGANMAPQLRRGNRLRSIQASLAIENNTLTLEQVTAVIDGRRVLGAPREIQEVRNAFAAYECLEKWNPASVKDLLAAHGILMRGLVDHPGRFRTRSVGIARGTEVIHVAPPAERVKSLMRDLLEWLRNTDAHPLVASCVFHYEFEFIHPFPDGNGRTGRLWQTLILSRWKPVFAFLPVETVIRDHTSEYYRALALSDNHADATPFIEFMLKSLLAALKDTMMSDQVVEQVSDPVKRLLAILASGDFKTSDLMARLGLSHRPTFRKNYLEPALTSGLIERTQPDSPQSPTQKYRLTTLGRTHAAQRHHSNRRKTR